MLKQILKFGLRATAVTCFLVAVVSIWLWVRSYDTADRVHGRAWGKESFLIGAKEGRSVWYWFTSHGHDQWWQWDLRNEPVDNEMSFPLGPIRQYESGGGFGKMNAVIYMVMPSTQTQADGTQIMFFGAATATLNGRGVIVPFWFIVLFLLLFGVLFSVEKPWQFGTRRLLFVVAIVSVVFAFASIVDRDKETLGPAADDAAATNVSNEPAAILSLIG